MKIIGLIAAVILSFVLWLTACSHSDHPSPDQGSVPTSIPAQDYSGTTPEPAPYDPSLNDPGFSQWESDLNQNNMDSTRCFTDATFC